MVKRHGIFRVFQRRKNIFQANSLLITNNHGEQTHLALLQSIYQLIHLRLEYNSLLSYISKTAVGYTRTHSASVFIFCLKVDHHVNARHRSGGKVSQCRVHTSQKSRRACKRHCSGIEEEGKLRGSSTGLC